MGHKLMFVGHKLKHNSFHVPDVSGDPGHLPVCAEVFVMVWRSEVTAFHS